MDTLIEMLLQRLKCFKMLLSTNKVDDELLVKLDNIIMFIEELDVKKYEIR